jgi:hypothetical protein
MGRRAAIVARQYAGARPPLLPLPKNHHEGWRESPSTCIKEDGRSLLAAPRSTLFHHEHEGLQAAVQLRLRDARFIEEKLSFSDEASKMVKNK